MEYSVLGNEVSAVINGKIFDSLKTEFIQKNIFIENGSISEISDRKPSNNKNVIDAKGSIVGPGFIDLHVHLREPGFEYKEDIKSGSLSAIAGGFTTILCMPNTNPANDSVETTKFIINRSKEVGLLDIFPVGAMTKSLKGEEICDYDAMFKEGIIAISDDGSCIQNEEIALKVFKIAAEKNILIISHPEIFELSKKGAINEGKISKKLNLPGISRDAENLAIKRDIKLAEKTGARLHLAHVSTKEGIEFVREAKMKKLRITCEVTPHHLLLSEDDVEKIGANAKMNPPLRTKSDIDALIEGLNDGTIDAIATDHAPHDLESKNSDLLKASFGIVGLETMLPVCLKLVYENKISLMRFLELITSSPAKIVGFEDRGVIEVQKRADITIFDPNYEVKIDPDDFKSKSKNSPFAGCKLMGKVLHTIVHGRMNFSAEEKIK